MTGPAKLYRDDRLYGSPRWVLTSDPDWMMRVPDEIRDCVCFVCYYNASGELRLAGTAFFVGLQPTEEMRASKQGFVYLVTCKHTVVGAKRRSSDGKVHVRVNHRDGIALLLEVADKWTSHPTDSSVDCVAIYADLEEQEGFRTQCVVEGLAATAEVRKKENIGIGDQIFFTGLFHEHAGRQRNIPILRVGNIAAMPEEPVASREFGPMDVILVEARSIGGLSGSPAFVELDDGKRFAWLGMVRGHWNVDELSEADAFDEDAEEARRINTGIALLVPVDQILEVLHHTDIQHEMEEALMDKEYEHEPTEDIAPAESTPGPEPERLKIDEPFEDAVERALEKKKPKEGWPEDTNENG